MLNFRMIQRLQPFLKSVHLSPATVASCGSICSNFQINPNESQNLQNVRFYAKMKDKKKDKARDKGFKLSAAKVSDEDLNDVVNVEKYREQLDKAIEQLKNEFIKNLSLRSTTGAIETLKVSYEKEEHELQEIAQIIRKNPKTIVVNMVSFPQIIPAALQTLQKSGMNLNPQQDGTTIFIPVPKVTKEHRVELSKNAKALFVKCKDNVRAIQNGHVKKLKTNKEISDDFSKLAQIQLVAIADTYLSQGEKLLESKQKELVGTD